ncbi:glycosyltransferase family 2 protein [Aquabacterium olei]
MPLNYLVQNDSAACKDGIGNLPLVSVITPCFNAKKFLPSLLSCVESQDFQLEHIIVDDCSDDGSWSELEALSRGRPWLKIHRLECRSGPIVARNKAIELAQGRFLAFLDADDLWLPCKTKRQVAFMVESQCGISFTDYRHMSEDGTRVGRLLRGPSRIGLTLHHTTRFMGCLTVVINRDVVKDFRFPEINPSVRAEDFLAWSRVIRFYGPAFRCPGDFARYRVVKNSRSSSKFKASLSVWRLYYVVEGLPGWKAGCFFILFLIFSAWKRLLYSPRLYVSGDASVVKYRL